MIYIYIYILARVVAYVLKFTNNFEYKTDLKRKKYPKITQVYNKRRYGKKKFYKGTNKFFGTNILLNFDKSPI